jgi:hypothetical protein
MSAACPAEAVSRNNNAAMAAALGNRFIGSPYFRQV